MGVAQRLLILVATAAALLVSVLPVAAQSASASLAGLVLTEEGDPVPGAVVQARSDGNGATRTTVTDDRGRYRFDGMSPGAWTVVARIGNGELSDSGSVQLHLQRTTKLNFTVNTTFSEHVTVRAEAPLVDRKDTAGKLFVTGAQADNLPVSGRVISDLALLDSAVRQAAPGNQFGERGAVFTVNGQSGRSNSFLVDGMDNNDLTSGTSLNSFFSQQVVKEFVLLTHQFAPEFGRASGGMMNIITRQGTNEHLGEFFVQGTANAWNESGDFVDSLPDSGESQAAVRRYQAGMVFGGPILRDRAFYFAAYEHQQIDDVIAYTGIDGNGVEGGRMIAPTTDDSLFLRTDFNLGAEHTLMFRLSANDRSSEGINVGGVYTPEAGFRVEENDVQFVGSLNSVISPKLLSETRFLVSTSQFDQFANSDAAGVDRPSGVFGGNVLNRQEREEEKFQLVQNFTVRAGAHTAKFGFDVIRSSTRIKARFNPNGNFLYDYDFPFEPGDCGDILVTQTGNAAPDGTIYCIGDPNGIDDDGDGVVDEPGNIFSYPLVYSLVQGEPEDTFDDTLIAVFAQDKVEVGRRWFLEYGLRYDLSTYTLPAGARVDSTIPNGGAGRDTNNIAPRFGFTFTPKPNGKSVIRGGAGIFYDKLVLAFPAVASITSGTKVGLFFPQGFAAETIEALLFPEPLTMNFSTATELETPYTVQFTLGYERLIGPSAAFRADLVRIQGYDLPLMKDLSPVTGLISGLSGFPLLVGQETACPVDRIDPTLEIGVPCHANDPEHGSLATLVTEGRSEYTGLDLNFRWQRDRSWYNASYTLSKAENQGFDPLKGGIYLPPDSTNLDAEYGRTDGDRRHRFVFSAEGEMFAGVRASTIIQYATGLPFNVTTGQDDNVDGIRSDRPAGVSRNEGEESSIESINEVRADSAVELEPIESLQEPVFFQIDLRVFKPFPIGGDKARGEFFLQVFNGPPRTVELGLKFAY
jgi:hypothetical protein